MPGSRVYDIWMPLAMILLVVIATVSVASFVLDHAVHDGVSMCTVIQGNGVPPTEEPCYLTQRSDSGWREPAWFPPASSTH